MKRAIGRGVRIDGMGCVGHYENEPVLWGRDPKGSRPVVECPSRLPTGWDAEITDRERSEEAEAVRRLGLLLRSDLLHSCARGALIGRGGVGDALTQHLLE